VLSHVEESKVKEAVSMRRLQESEENLIKLEKVKR
jgi:hypothetical protein